MRNLTTETITCDVLVIGGGLAALTAAYAASGRGAKVLIACKKKVGRSGNTLVSANGFAAVLPGYDPTDSKDIHFTDTLCGGAMVNDEKLVRVLVSEASEALDELERLGMCFQSNGARKSVKKAPGHSRMRFFNVEGFNGGFFAQGRGITFPLREKVGQAGVKFLDETMITSLLVQDGRVTGARGLSLREKCLVLIKAKTVIISSGGGGRIYHSTNNTSDATGDGYALAWDAGASLRDMEYIQFFPSFMVYPFRLTVPTPLFADGAVLKNALGQRFMFDYAPEGEMATRDIVARAIYLEMQRGRKCREGIQIDFSSIPNQVLENRYAILVNHFRKSGRELKTGYFEVAPVVHHFMGGIAIDEKCRTRIQGLYAAGEAAGGVHGANRLAGNALTEAAVFGLIAGREAAWEAQKSKHRQYELPLDSEESFFQKGDIALGEIKEKLCRSMDKGAGVVRSGKTLEDALDEIERCKSAFPYVRTETLWDIVCYNELRNMCLTGEIICRSALKREESRGAHYREDYPEQDDSKGLGSFQCGKNDSGRIMFNWQPKKLTNICGG